MELLQAIPSARMIAAVFLAVLFLQSGLDKVIDWKGNLSWLQEHFKNSPLKNMVTFNLGLITLLEILTGLISAIGFFMLITDGSPDFALLGAQLAGISLAMLFFGQRLAKDYEGAASLISYAIFVLISIVLFSDLPLA
ncbi:MAG: DoxX family protein [Bacteroidota bacterium]